MNLHQTTNALTECDREPIHQIGAVQSFGGLIAIDAEGRIVQCSTNLADLLGLADLPTPGTPLAEVIAPGETNRIAPGSIARIACAASS